MDRWTSAQSAAVFAWIVALNFDVATQLQPYLAVGQHPLVHTGRPGTSSCNLHKFIDAGDAQRCVFSVEHTQRAACGYFLAPQARNFGDLHQLCHRETKTNTQ